MAQIRPSPSRQLAVTAAAFRRARRKFPKNLGVCPCSANLQQSYFQTHPKSNGTATRFLDSDARGRGNCASFPSLSSPRTASWSNECHGAQRMARSEVIRVANCGKSRSRSRAIARVTVNEKLKGIQEQGSTSRVEDDLASNSKTSTLVCRNACRKMAISDPLKKSKQFVHNTKLTIKKPVSEQKSCESFSSSKSTNSSCRRENKWEDPDSRDRFGVVTSFGKRSSPKVHKCLTKYCLHGYPDCHQKAFLDGQNDQPKDEAEKFNYSDSPTMMDFPTKLQTWEHRTSEDFDRRKMPTRQSSRLQKTCSKDQISKFGSRPENSAVRKPHSHRTKIRSPPLTSKKSKEPNRNADVCLRPSLIKAAQRNIEFNVKNCVENLHLQNQGITDHRRSKSSDVNPCLEDDLKIIKHRDSMSILMDKFRKLNNNQINCNRGTKCSKNLNEVNLILGDEKRFEKSKQPLRRLHDLTFKKIHRHREADSSPVNDQSVNSFENNYNESTEHFSSGKIISAGMNMATKFENGINGTLGVNKARLKNLRGVCYN